MAFYWVNIGVSKQEVKDYSYLWAPTHSLDKNQKRFINAGWIHMPKVKVGDVLFCHYEKKIQFIAISKKPTYKAKRPKSREFIAWKQEGYKIEVDLKMIDNPIDRDIFLEDIINFYNKDCSPKLITEKNNVSQQYLFSIPDGLGALILDYIGDDSIKIQDIVSKNKKSKKPNKTTKEAIINARVGQGAFRKDVLALWNNTCPVTNVNKKELLIASHIVSWQLSTDEEKLDKFNGLPLSPSADKLFDRGYISFDDKGNMILNNHTDPNIVTKLGIKLNTKINNLTSSHKIYLAKHRERFNFMK